VILLLVLTLQFLEVSSLQLHAEIIYRKYLRRWRQSGQSSIAVAATTVTPFVHNIIDVLNMVTFTL